MCSWTVFLELLGVTWAPLGLYMASLGRLLGPTWPLLASNKGVLGASWPPSGGSWGHLGANLALLASILVPPSAAGAHLEVSQALFGTYFQVYRRSLTYLFDVENASCTLFLQLCYAMHLVLHWLLEVHYLHSADSHVVLYILVILPIYVDLNQQEHSSIYIYICIYYL